MKGIELHQENNIHDQGGVGEERMRKEKGGVRGREKGRAIVIDWDTSGGMIADHYFLLHIASEQSVDGPAERGIVLQRTAAHGTYARIGSFFVPPGAEYPFSELELAFSGRLQTLSMEDYIELGPNGKYSIDIVLSSPSLVSARCEYNSMIVRSKERHTSPAANVQVCVAHDQQVDACSGALLSACVANELFDLLRR